MIDGGVVYLESGHGDQTLEALTALGHRAGRTEGGYGGYQAIGRDSETGIYLGASESRKDGHAAGY